MYILLCRTVKTAGDVLRAADTRFPITSAVCDARVSIGPIN